MRGCWACSVRESLPLTWQLALQRCNCRFQATGAPPVQRDAEDKIVAAARQLKQARPGISTLFYLNSVMDWPEYRLHKTMQANPTWYGTVGLVDARLHAMVDVYVPARLD